MKIKIKVIPRSSKNEIVGEMGDGSLKIKLTAPPVDGKANESLVELLSAHYKCTKKAIKIIAGTSSTRKTVEILI